MDGGQRHSRRRSSLPISSNLQRPNTGSAPLQIRNVPAPLPTPAPLTPPASAGLRIPKNENTTEMISRPPTPGPSPTLDPDFSELNLDGEEGDLLLEKGKARARDGELVGPDLRRESSVEDNSMCTLEYGVSGIIADESRPLQPASPVSEVRQIATKRVFKRIA